MDKNTLSHTTWECKYHIVFAPKFRRQVIYGAIKADVANILSTLCKRKGVEIIEAECCPDHIHMLVRIPPNISVSSFMGYLKGKSSLMIFDRHANLKYKYGKDIITDPKTVKSNRMITMPEFLSEELESYIGMLYGLNENDRIFQISKSYLHHEMDRGVKLSGVKRIRIHDLRHSHVSLLVNMGYSAVAIGERVGHESVEITYRYAHLFPTIQTEMAENLNQEREEYLDE